jgi:hypothetical protein
MWEPVHFVPFMIKEGNIKVHFQVFCMYIIMKMCLLYLVLLDYSGNLHYIVVKGTVGLNGNFLCFRRDGVSVSYTVICLSHFDVCLAIT